MNVYSKDFNPYISCQLRGVSESKLANPLIVELAWNMLCDTISRIDNK